MRSLVCAFVVGISMVAAIANGTSINVDFHDGAGTYSGVAAAPDTGTFWNNGGTSNGTSAALNNSLNGITGVTITVSGSNGGYCCTGDYTNSGAPNLVSDQMYAGGFGTVSVQINNLTPSQPYSLYLYETRGNPDETTRFRVIDANGTSAYVTSTADNSSTTGFTLIEDYVLFSGLLPDINNRITFEFNGVYDQYGAINGFQLLAVPEPTSLTMLALGTIGCLTIARHRRRW